MRKIVTLDECDYDKIVEDLRDAVDIISTMRTTEKSALVDWNIKNALKLLTERDAIYTKVSSLEALIDY